MFRTRRGSLPNDRDLRTSFTFVSNLFRISMFSWGSPNVLILIAWMSRTLAWMYLLSDLVCRMRAVHLGHFLYWIMPIFWSLFIHWINEFTSIMWWQSVSSMNLAFSSSSVPKSNNSANFSFWQIRHNCGAGSPQTPIDWCEHFFISSLLACVHISRSHGSQQRLVHSKCSQPQPHFSLHWK